MLQMYCVGAKLSEAVRSFYEESNMCVYVEREEDGCFQVKLGLKQGVWCSHS